MSSRLPTDEALEKEDRIDEIKKIKHSPPIPHLLQAQQAPALPYAKVVGRPGTASYPAPSPDPTPLPTLPLTPIRVIDCKISRKLRLENAQNVQNAHKNHLVAACHRIPLRSYVPFVYCSKLFPNKCYMNDSNQV